MLLSHATIVRNEAATLPDFLRRFDPLYDEFVIIDTGSTDGTLDIQHPKLRLIRSTRFTASTPRREFDFAAARNEALDQVRGDWVGSFDPDDRLPAKTVRMLRMLFEGPKVADFDLVMCHHSSGSEYLPKPHFWRMGLNLRYEDALDEVINPPPHTKTLRLTNVAFEHTRSLGGMTPDAARARAEFYAGIAERQLELHPNSTSQQWKLARQYANLKRYDEAIPLFQSAIAQADDTMSNSALAWLMIYLAQCYCGVNDAEAAIKQLLAALDTYEWIAYARYLVGQIYEQLGQLDEAEKWYREAMATPPAPDLIWIDAPEFKDKVPKEALERLARKRQEVPCGTN